MYSVLKPHADEKYREFSSKLIPNIDIEKIIGVRVPILRKIAKEIYREDGQNFLENLPHFYHEENLIHAFLINEIKDEKIASDAIFEFAKYMDNWAVTDSINPKAFKNNSAAVRTLVDRLLKQSGEYQIRLAIILMMKFLQGENFVESDLDTILNMKTDFYYVNMARAWYIAELAHNNSEHAIDFIKSQKLDAWCQNKAIQKIRESRKIDDSLKNQLEQYKKICG